MYVAPTTPCMSLCLTKYCVYCACREYGGTSISTKDEKIEQENKKKKERFEAARQAAMKDAANSDIESRGRMGAGSDRGRGYDRLTVFPAGDKELEMTTGEPVSTDIAVPEVFSIAAAQSI